MKTVESHNAPLTGKIDMEVEKAIAAIPLGREIGLLLAMEFGYRQCEKGNNIQMARENFKKTIGIQ
jgi:hypothetical protein